MELTDDNLRTLSEYLQKTLSPDPDIRRPSEKFLESVEGNRNYPMLLLHLVNKAEVDLTIRIAGAVTFKNYVKRNWPVDEETGVDRIHSDDREGVKQLIVEIMLSVPSPVQKQLSDAVSIIGRSDFPAKWPTLLPHMVDKFNTGDFHVINGVLHTAHSLFKRYRYEFKSEALWTEIKFVLDSFAKPLTDLFVATHSLTTVHANNPEALKVIYGSLLLISKIFYSLNYQDLPEFFEDNMPVWMPLFRNLLSTRVYSLENDDDEEVGVMENLRSQVCFNVVLYASKYGEEFQPYLMDFVNDIWQLLVTTGLQSKYDLLVSNALQFLSTVASGAYHKDIFTDPMALLSICEKVIIPNVQFRQVDEELFEDNPEEYIRRDIEGSDVETRRRSACDLLKALAATHEQQITPFLSQYVQKILDSYAADPTQWRSKNVAVYLVTSLAGKGQTQKSGVTVASAFVPITDFYTAHVIPELDKEVNTMPVVKADCIKYVLLFRSVLPPDAVVAALPQLIRHLTANAQVVHSYAATCIEKMLVMKTSDDQLLVKREMLAPLAPELLPALFNCLTMRGSEENEYVMKAVMRSFSTLGPSVVPFLGRLLPKLTEKLATVARNPSKPHFNHFLFETITLSIRIVCKENQSAVTSFEEALFPIFQIILQQDVQEFLPYVLQVLSMLLSLHADIPPAYLALYPCLLTPVLWERTGNVHPLTALLRAFISKSTPQIAQETIKVSSLLGVFQKLISSRANDHEGFHLIESIMEFFPKDTLEPYIKQVMMLLFQRLSSSKTTKFIKGVIVFFSFFINIYGAQTFVQMVDSIQPQMFGMIVERLIVPDAQKISGNVERKIAAVGLTRLLAEGKLLESPYAQHWPVLLKVLIGLFELPEDESVHPEDHFIEVDETPGYEVAYAQLAFADRTIHDPLKDIQDPKAFLANCLGGLAQSGVQLVPLISQSLTPKEKQHLMSYLESARVSIGT